MSLMPFTLDLRLWRWQVPGGDKLPRQLVGDAMPRSRGVDAAFDGRHGYPDATRVRCPCRLLGPGRHRNRYHSDTATKAGRLLAQSSSRYVRSFGQRTCHALRATRAR
jgi:hypothetical protein